MSKDEYGFGWVFKLCVMGCKMILSGARNPDNVANPLPEIVGLGNGYLRRLYEKETIQVSDMAVFIYEMIEGGNYSQLFGSLGELDRLCFLSDERIEDFCHTHRDKLSVGSGRTIFLLKIGSSFSVVHAYLGRTGKLEKCTNDFRWDHVWPEGRLVVPATAVLQQ